MRHYEIVLLLHPEQTTQADALLEHFNQTIREQKGTTHRFENLGKRPLAYEINGLTKAIYALLNVEIEAETLKNLEEQFQYNDTVLRHLILKMDGAMTQPSPLTKSAEGLDRDLNSTFGPKNSGKPPFRAQSSTDKRAVKVADTPISDQG